MVIIKSSEFKYSMVLNEITAPRPTTKHPHLVFSSASVMGCRSSVLLCCWAEEKWAVCWMKLQRGEISRRESSCTVFITTFRCHPAAGSTRTMSNLRGWGLSNLYLFSLFDLIVENAVKTFKTSLQLWAGKIKESSSIWWLKNYRETFTFLTFGPWSCCLEQMMQLQFSESHQSPHFSTRTTSCSKPRT